VSTSVARTQVLGAALTMRQGIKRLVIAAGLEAPARALVTTVRRRSRIWDRTIRDHEHIRMLLAFALPADANCVDVGAANGRVLETIVRVAPRGRHIAYEPVAEFHETIRARFPQVDVRSVALSDEGGETTFTYVRDRPHVSGFRPRDYRDGGRQLETIRVRTARLDDDLPQGYAPHLIKVDVEGAEEMVFRGALQTIIRHRPILVFQHGRGSAEAYGTKPGAIFRLLTNDAGLRIFDMDGGGPYTSAAFDQAYDTNSHFHFVARP
jgi:FkbM family methyltransferase